MCTGYFDVHRNALTVHWVIFLRIARCFCMNSYLFHNSPIPPEKQKSAAQNRTKTTNCPNSVSYGAWKIFSPYGSCSACTIRNRFALFGFQSVSAVSAFDTQIIQYTLPKKQELYFPLRMRVRLFRLIAKYKKQMSPQGFIRIV